MLMAFIVNQPSCSQTLFCLYISINFMKINIRWSVDCIVNKSTQEWNDKFMYFWVRQGWNSLFTVITCICIWTFVLMIQNFCNDFFVICLSEPYLFKVHQPNFIRKKKYTNRSNNKWSMQLHNKFLSNTCDMNLQSSCVFTDQAKKKPERNPKNG